jgi:hypothetical protein
MATVDRTRSGAFVAASRALDAAIEAVLEGEAGRASGTTFVPADLARTDRLSWYRRLGPVSIVDAEGNETRLPRDRTREFLLGAALVGILAWIAGRAAPPRS